MALINCPECGKEVSDKAKSCPYCGMPLVSEGLIPDAKANETKTVLSSEPKSQTKKSGGIKIVLFSILLWIAFFVGVIVIIEKTGSDLGVAIFSLIITVAAVLLIIKAIKSIIDSKKSGKKYIVFIIAIILSGLLIRSSAFEAASAFKTYSNSTHGDNPIYAEENIKRLIAYIDKNGEKNADGKLAVIKVLNDSNTIELVKESDSSLSVHYRYDYASMAKRLHKAEEDSIYINGIDAPSFVFTHMYSSLNSDNHDVILVSGNLDNNFTYGQNIFDSVSNVYKTHGELLELKKSETEGDYIQVSDLDEETQRDYNDALKYIILHTPEVLDQIKLGITLKGLGFVNM